ncbi:Pectate trisaccharide-lyase [Colletotrichum tanaceti]|uniref:Pectate trisaccharide-lyase n=1 Tax=Colletotrichum tanaceti TaxID=1306861 RepID=A0A4U6X254_9PEZI|nr:Pectate trisaccharide-lyase [Colletotrichum tanaceti]
MYDIASGLYVSFHGPEGIHPPPPPFRLQERKKTSRRKKKIEKRMPRQGPAVTQVGSRLTRLLLLLLPLLTLLPALGAGAATTDAVTCARCDDVAHGFASLNGGTTGGKGGRIVTATSHAELVAYADATEPLVIRVEGELASEPRGYEIPVRSHKTIVGVGAGAKILGGGFGITNQSNIILRNLQVSDTYIPEDYNGKSEDWDGIQVDGGTNLWIDHVTVRFSPLPASYA